MMRGPIRLTLTLSLVLGFLLAACAFPAAPAPTPTPSPGPGPTATQLPKAGGEQRLIEAAKKEGEVVLWTYTWER